MPNPPDQFIQYEPQKCTACSNANECQADKRVCDTRYEIDINVKTIVTTHQSMRVQCPLSSEALTGKFPDNITSTIQYGVNLEALAISLNTTGMVSIDRTYEIMSGVFGVPISTGTIAAMVSGCTGKVSDTVNNIKEAIINEPLIHVDETGTRVDKKTIWTQTASTEGLTYIEVQEKRGKDAINAIGILIRFMETAIHVCWASYFLYTAIIHALCNAHLLCELTAVWENTRQQ